MELLVIILELVIADLILGGDNAVVISMATKNLPSELKMRASVYGALAAIALRVVFIFIVLMFGEQHIIFLNLIAGGFLVKIAIDLIKQDEEEHEVKTSSKLGEAVKTIVIADAVMSFDNAVVIASIADKAPVSSGVELLLIVFALFISFPIILFGASLLTKVIDKYAFIVYFFGIILIHVGLELASQDSIFGRLHMHINENILFYGLWIITLVIFACVYLVIKRSKDKQEVRV